MINPYASIFLGHYRTQAERLLHAEPVYTTHSTDTQYFIILDALSFLKVQEASQYHPDLRGKVIQKLNEFTFSKDQLGKKLYFQMLAIGLSPNFHRVDPRGLIEQYNNGRRLAEDFTPQEFICYLYALSEEQRKLLVKLDVSLTENVNDAFLKELAKMAPNLKELKFIKDYDFSNEGILNLQSLSQLESLDLAGVPLDDAMPNRIATLSRLKHLRLEKCTSLSDEGVKALAALPQLETLNISQCFRITDEGIRQLERHPTLTRLEIRYCNDVTDGAVESLEDHTPKLEVIFQRQIYLRT